MVCDTMKNIRHYFNPNEYPTNEWYRQHLERNYDMIIFGDAIAKSVTPQNVAGRIFNFTLKEQMLAMDFMVLQQTFSILKEGGTALFVLNAYQCCLGWKTQRDLRPYYWLFWPYYIARNPLHLFYIRVVKRLPLLMLRPYDVYCMMRRDTEEKIFEREIKREKRELTKLTSEKREAGIAKTITLIKTIIDFCTERNIKPVFSFAPFTFTTNNEALTKKIRTKYSEYITDFSKLTC